MGYRHFCIYIYYTYQIYRWIVLIYAVCMFICHVCWCWWDRDADEICDENFVFFRFRYAYIYIHVCLRAEFSSLQLGSVSCCVFCICGFPKLQLHWSKSWIPLANWCCINPLITTMKSKNIGLVVGNPWKPNNKLPKWGLVLNEHQWYGDLGMVHLSVYHMVPITFPAKRHEKIPTQAGHLFGKVRVTVREQIRQVSSCVPLQRWYRLIKKMGGLTNNN